jgi:hypothetical protein
LHAESCAKQNKKGTTQHRAERHPTPQPPKRLPALFEWRRRKIIERFRKFTPALRKKNSTGIHLLGRFERFHQRFVEPALLGKLCGTGRACSKVRPDQRILLFAGLAASIEDQQRRNLFAPEWLRRAHRKPPKWLRNFRVARKSEFFTVSSVVPSASPMARNFNP